MAAHLRSVTSYTLALDVSTIAIGWAILPSLPPARPLVVDSGAIVLAKHAEPFAKLRQALDALAEILARAEADGVRVTRCAVEEPSTRLVEWPELEPLVRSLASKLSVFGDKPTEVPAARNLLLALTGGKGWVLDVESGDRRILRGSAVLGGETQPNFQLGLPNRDPH